MKNTDLSYYLEEYLKNRPPFLAVIRAKEAFLYQNYLPLKKTTLDVGCGDGFFAKLAVGNVDIGLDLENSRMNQAINIYKNKIVYNGLKIPLKTNSVATAMSNSVLEHVSDLDQVLREIFRVLKKGGLLICPVMAKPWENYLLNIKFYKDWMRKKQEHINLLSREEWQNKFKLAGFRKVEEIGHLNKNTCKIIEALHYWSIPNLLLYTFTGKWTWNNKYILPFSKKFLLEMLSENTDPNLSGAIFYVWKKV